MSKGKYIKVSTEATLFSLDELKNRRFNPYRNLNYKKKRNSNDKLWMELYPDPKQRDGTLLDNRGLLRSTKISRYKKRI